MFSLTEVDSSWLPFFKPHAQEIESILNSIVGRETTPPRELIFKAFLMPMEDVKVLILGQDPYPTLGVADGLAFSSSRSEIIPASLRNIFLEYSNDLGYEIPTSGDLGAWHNRGVLLLNTALTTEVGERDVDNLLGWQNLIGSVIHELSRREVVAILWGNSARKLGKEFNHKIESAHPSPLSAYRGFFGSKPFSKTNIALSKLGLSPVNWRLK